MNDFDDAYGGWPVFDWYEGDISAEVFGPTEKNYPLVKKDYGSSSKWVLTKLHDGPGLYVFSVEKEESE